MINCDVQLTKALTSDINRMSATDPFSMITHPNVISKISFAISRQNRDEEKNIVKVRYRHLIDDWLTTLSIHRYCCCTDKISFVKKSVSLIEIAKYLNK